MAQLEELEQRKRALEEEISHLEWNAKRLETLIKEAPVKMAEISFEGKIANLLLETANSTQNEKAEEKRRKKLEHRIKRAWDLEEKNNQEANPTVSPCRMIVKELQKVRPYSEVEMINLLICISQGFLTIFAGPPGCGKTTICNYLAKTLGSTELEQYAAVSVECGWTSKRDFVGYYNPLTKSFDKSNQAVFELLEQCHLEAEEQITTFPFYILLDEANLSPMEHYWADFMNLCDELDENSKLNLGENYELRVHEGLHFFATMNNDFSTVELSPRLIDRGWVITLPEVKEIQGMESSAQITPQPVTWACLRKLFCEPLEVDEEEEKIPLVYEEVRTFCERELNMSISPRIQKAILKYWRVARLWFEACTEEERSQEYWDLVALDYALSQRVLPKIDGHDQEYGRKLEHLREICKKNHLNRCDGILKRILDTGELNYYQFF